MRAGGTGWVFALLVGIVLASATAAPALADEKVRIKEPQPGSRDDERLSERVVIREWSEQDNAFTPPVRTQAFFSELAGKPVICVWEGFGRIAVGSTIEHNGLVYTVTESGETITCQRCHVRLRPASRRC